MNRLVNLIKVPFYKGQLKRSVKDAPDILYNKLITNHNFRNDGNPDIKGLYTLKQAITIKNYASQLNYNINSPNVFLGGDHGISMATIAGVSQNVDDLQILWIDAHADVNTPKTSPSGNLHGMPVAHLMGLTDNKDFECLNPLQINYIGLRSVDKDEAYWINQNKVNAYHIDDIYWWFNINCNIW